MSEETYAARYEFDGCGRWIWDENGSHRCGHETPCPMHDPDPDADEADDE